MGDGFWNGVDVTFDVGIVRSREFVNDGVIVPGLVFIVVSAMGWNCDIAATTACVIFCCRLVFTDSIDD